MPALRKTLLSTLVLALLALPGMTPRTLAASDTAGLRFLRVATDADGQPLALQVSIVTYRGTGKHAALTVDLIGAVHVGERAYYAALNERFTRYDALLYELIAEQQRAQSMPEEGEQTGVVSGAQHMMKDVLDLTFQLDEIDYGRKNFVHADFSPEELSQNMADRGESLYGYFWRLFFVTFAESAKDPFGIRELHKLTRAASSGRDNALKVALAYELTAQEGVLDIFGGKDGSALIEGRNQRALDVLKERVAKGDTHIGIFYGAGHMPDIEERLLDQLDLARRQTIWLDAWDLKRE